MSTPESQLQRKRVRRVFLFCTLFAAFAFCAAAETSQTITIAAATNSADFQPGLPQRGSLASIFTTGLQGSGVYTASGNPLSNRWNDISVWVNFAPAPILAIAFLNGYQQINIQVPWEGQRDPLYVEVFQGNTRAHAEIGPGDGRSTLFSDANGYGVVLHGADYSLVTPQKPARAGENLIAYAINLGPVTNTPATGAPAASEPLSRSTPPGTPSDGICVMSDAVNIGSAGVAPSFVGLAPGMVGVYQVNFQVPASAPAGNLPFAFSRTVSVNPFGTCHGSGLGSITSTTTSRSVLLPVQ